MKSNKGVVFPSFHYLNGRWFLQPVLAIRKYWDINMAQFVDITLLTASCCIFVFIWLYFFICVQCIIHFFHMAVQARFISLSISHVRIHDCCEHYTFWDTLSNFPQTSVLSDSWADSVFGSKVTELCEGDICLRGLFSALVVLLISFNISICIHEVCHVCAYLHY